jgi:hypothetical protein
VPAFGALRPVGLDDVLWLDLTRRERRAHPAFTDAGLVAERAAAHPEFRRTRCSWPPSWSADRSESWQHVVVMRQSRALLDAAAGGPAGEHLEVRAVLWDALVKASGIGAART